MNKRIFPISKNCYIIYTGQSSSDEKSFLRIGSNGNIDKDIQRHIGYIVIPDATKVDYPAEINDIKYMEKGKIRYICNKENQEKLFKKLEESGVNESDIFHKDLSKDLDNISRIDNKKHFFTVFYENKNVKIVSDDEVFFELFDSTTEGEDFVEQEKRLRNFIDTLEKLKIENTDKKIFTAIKTYSTNKDIENKKCSFFLLQEKSYIPLNPRMFRVVRTSELKARFICNSSVMFNIGKEIKLAVVIDGREDCVCKGMIDSGEVIESQVLYSYSFDVKFKSIEDMSKVLSIYSILLTRVAR